MAACGLGWVDHAMNFMAPSLFLLPRGITHESHCSLPWFHSRPAFAPCFWMAKIRPLHEVASSTSPSDSSCAGWAPVVHHTLTCFLMRSIDLNARSTSRG